MSQQPSIKSLVGQRFGRLLVTEPAPKPHTRADRRWLCQCDCGKTKVVAHHQLLGGNCRSCGCLRSELSAARVIKHGLRKSPEYGIWNAMKNRCYNPHVKHHKDYGGRGIKVCDRWRDSFEAFITDMGRRPGPEYTIERENNDGDYEPGNCKWATRFEQQRNTRKNVILNFNEQSKTVAEWAETLNIRSGTIRERLRRGWTVEQTLSMAVGKWRK
jgi:hypothetical protein